MNNFYKLLYMFNGHTFLNCNKYLAAKAKNFYVSQYFNGLSKPKAFMLSALSGKQSYSDCKSTPPPPSQCEEGKDTKKKTFNIFAEQCHWIRQLKDGEDDPTFDGQYYNHRMYHKYTYHDVVSHLRPFRLPQPSNKRIVPIAAVVQAMPKTKPRPTNIPAPTKKN